MSLTMTTAEREAFLADVHVGILSVSEPGRGPLTAPIWYHYEPGGELWVVTAETSRKGKLLRAAERFSLCVQSEAPPYKYVSVEGPITSIARSDRDAHERPLAHRYLGPEFGEQYLAATSDPAARAADPPVRIAMRPERWLTTDYSRQFRLERP